MYEMTKKGAWFRWSALDRTEKRLLLASCLLAAPAGAVAGLAGGDFWYKLGYWMGSAGRWPSEASGYADNINPGPLAAFTLFAALCALLSALLWWRFSLRQDEMFNRVQNHALGHGSAWTVGALALWWTLYLGGILPPAPAGLFVLLGVLLISLFWLAAARRWA
jgi:hypothetical protein